MQKIKRVFVTGDLLRQRKFQPGVSSQNTNILWLYNLVRPAVELISDFTVKPILYTGEEFCLGRQLYEINNLSICFHSWVKIYNREPLERELAAIQSTFDEALVVGFEMPELMVKGLDELEIPYIDFTIHPARFMDDLAFGIRSNIPMLGMYLEKWILKSDEIHVFSGLAMSTLVRLPRISECEGEEVAIFAGQTNDDKVLIHDRRMIEVEDVLDQLSEMCCKHDKVLVKPHPMAPENHFIMALTRLFTNTQIIGENFYHLLSHDSVKCVYSLTSSTSIEAGFFDKTGVHMCRYPYLFTDHTAIGGGYLSIKPGFYLPDFWKMVFDSLYLSTKCCNDIEISMAPNRLRKSLRSYWGADIFESI